MNMKLLNVRIVNHDQIIPNANVFIENGMISKIEVIPGKGKMTIVPGFIDTHIHGFGGHDCMDSSYATEIISAKIAKNGTTAFMPTVMTESWDRLRKVFREQSVIQSSGARILGIHLEGPFISKVKKGAHNEDYIIKATEAKIDELFKLSDGLLKKITLAPEEVSANIIKYAIAKGIIVSIGHTNGDAKDVAMASKAGASSATHLWNAMTGVENRKPGVVEAVLNDDTLYAEVILDLLHVDKEAIKLSINAKTPARIMAVTDSLRAAGMRDGEYESGGLEITKHGSKITLKDSDTIAGSAATMHDCYLNLLKLGYNEMDAVTMTSYNAAQYVGLSNIGHIAEGMMADIVVLDEKKNIKKVIINGVETH